MRRKMTSKLHSHCWRLASYISFCLVCTLSAILVKPLVANFGTVSAFHLNFGHRLLRSAQNPQLNPSSTLIRPIECRNANNHTEVGICMFSIDCMQNKGVPLSVCKHNYFVGTCCRLPDYNNFVGIVYDLRETDTNQLLEARRVAATTTMAAPNLSASSTVSTTTDSAALASSSAGGAAESALLVALEPIPSKLDSKYIISSTSLFPSGATVANKPTSVAQAHANETARNNNGPLQLMGSADRNQAQLLVASELDSFQIQTALVSSSSSSDGRPVAEVAPQLSKIGQQQQYELIKDDKGDAPAALSSAHSKPADSASLPAHLKPKPSFDQVQGGSNTTSSATVAQQIFAEDSAATTTKVSARPQVVVLANNHQQVSRPPALNTENPTLLAEGQPPRKPTTPAPGTEQDFTFAPLIEQVKPLPVTSTPLLDLVSGNGLSQTTTPFTTSLSTALLPNVSSHPYAPTTIASIGSVESTSASPSSSAAPLASTIPQVTTVATSSNQLVSNLSQFYAPVVDVGERPASVAPQRSSLGTLPLNSMAKIVSSSASGSAVNQLMPGFGNLQSAILSHIPFKIASGLSSGLSSYLQAAMKPSGSKPVIASNNAPAASYLQHTSSTTRAPFLNVTSVGLVRFPSTSADTSSSPAPTSNPTVSASSVDVVREAQMVCGKPQVTNTVGTESKRRVARIVGGNQSLFGQWPWMVSLRQWRKGAFLHKCGAALLNENWAITAAHCVENVKPADLLLRLGEFDVSNQDEPFPYHERRVKTVVSHPSFDPKTFEYDLALLRFAEPIKYERNILPVCVPTGNDSYVDRMATVIGWGRLYEDGPLPDVIQHVDVPIITNNECEKMYKNAGYIEEIPNMFICAGISKGGRDSCEGDSGGPLTMVDNDGRSYLVGIISWGIGCALPSQPGVYTRITAFSSWINQITAF